MVMVPKLSSNIGTSHGRMNLLRGLYCWASTDPPPAALCAMCKMYPGDTSSPPTMEKYLICVCGNLIKHILILNTVSHYKTASVDIVLSWCKYHKRFVINPITKSSWHLRIRDPRTVSCFTQLAMQPWY